MSRQPDRSWSVVTDEVTAALSKCKRPIMIENNFTSQMARLIRMETGIDISRATMDGWVMRCGELLMPVARAIGRQLLGGGYIQADETPVPVQMHDGSGKNHQGYLWQYSRPGGSAVFEFRMGRGREADAV